MIFLGTPNNIQKYALIVANDHYCRQANRLINSITNARELDNILQSINFNVTKHEDMIEKDTFMEQVIAFTKTFINGDIVLFYFSGHAIQFNGNNYLIPINDTKIDRAESVAVFGVNLKRILDRLMENKPLSVFILVLDCCRPYELSRRSATTCQYIVSIMSSYRNYLCTYLATAQNEGLHTMDIPDGRKVFIQFSCAANKTTTDNLFNKYLLLHIDRKNVPVTEVFQDITKDVYHKRDRRLKPFLTNKLAKHAPVYLNRMPSGMYIRSKMNIDSLQSFYRKSCFS